MKFYLVFGSIRRPSDFMGGRRLDWGQPPIGVYHAEDAESACIAAAKENGQMATYFAIEGKPWGVDMVEAPAAELGKTESSSDRLARVLDRMEKNDEEIRRLRLEAAEEKSAQMEREAGIGPDAEVDAVE